MKILMVRCTQEVQKNMLRYVLVYSPNIAYNFGVVMSA
jgi:hypothetical protein